jgi:diguanylate cyclase
MSENNSPQQHQDVWKKKYLDSLDQLEELEQSGDLLKRTIQRLILAAQGQDPQLDKQLDVLRHAMSGKLSEAVLHRSHEELSKALMRLDAKRQVATDSGASSNSLLLSGADLGGLVDGLSWPKPYTRKAKNLAERFRALSRSEDSSPLFRELSHMFGEVLATDAVQVAGDAPGLIRRIFSVANSVGERDFPSTEDRSPESKSGDRKGLPSQADNADYATLFARFLNKVQLPPPASSQVDALAEKLERPVTHDDQADLLLSFADLINDSCEHLHQERSDLEEFLRSLTERLQDIDRHIQQVDKTRTLSARSNADIQQSITAEVDNMRTSVKTAKDLVTLKGVVSQSLDTITVSMENFIRSEEIRKEQDRALTAQLTQRMLKLQDETDELRENVSRERRQAVRDPLTDLPNRLAYNERAKQEFVRWKRYHTPLSMAVIDVDHFKHINDDFGHQAGDKALQLVGGILVKKLREADFVARYGGDEFVVLMPETTAESAEIVAAKLVHGVANSGFHFHEKPVSLTLSIGVSALIENDTLESLFARADAALYTAKEAGRNCARTKTS